MRLSAWHRWFTLLKAAQAYHDSNTDAAPSRWHIETIKAHLRIRFGSLTKFARKHGYHRSAISIALVQPWPAVERIIADALGEEPWVIWPDRYTPRTRQPRPRAVLIKEAKRSRPSVVRAAR